MTDEPDIADFVGSLPCPFATDSEPFSVWLRAQVRRKDPVGALARVAMQDPYWPGGGDRGDLASYFQKMGARQFVMKSVREAWDEFEAHKRRSNTRDKARAARQARKKNRASRR